jgi:hypothetical protein
VHGIYVAGILTTAIAVAIFGALIRSLRSPANERLLWLAALIALPLEPLAFYFIRVPLDHWLEGQLVHGSATYLSLISLYAPVTEEAAKLIPLLIPAIRRDISPANFARYAIAIGLGFAIGEMWFIAEQIARVPAYQGMPFYLFGGYISERLMTCVFHSVFVGVALWRWRRGFVFGVLGAMALHWMGNFPIFLMAWDVGGMGKTFWAAVVQGWLILYFLGALALLSYFAFGRVSPALLFYGRRKCPECGEEYDASLFFAFNFGKTRYERCPHCRHWHWTT